MLKVNNAVVCKTLEIRNAIIALAIKRGYKVYKETELGLDFSEFPNLLLDRDNEIVGTSSVKNGFAGYTFLTIEEFIDGMEVKIPEIELTRDYNGLITEDGLVVSGNLITRDTFERLFVYVNTYKERSLLPTISEKVGIHGEHLTKELHISLFSLAKKLGYSVREESLFGKDWDDNFYNVIYKDGSLTASRHNLANENYEWLTLSDFIIRLERGIIPAFEGLSTKYAELTLDKRGLHVGCQCIDWKTWDDLVVYFNKYSDKIK